MLFWTRHQNQQFQKNPLRSDPTHLVSWWSFSVRSWEFASGSSLTASDPSPSWPTIAAKTSAYWTVSDSCDVDNGGGGGDGGGGNVDGDGGGDVYAPSVQTEGWSAPSSLRHAL